MVSKNAIDFLLNLSDLNLMETASFGIIVCPNNLDTTGPGKNMSKSSAAAPTRQDDEQSDTLVDLTKANWNCKRCLNSYFLIK